MVDISQVFRLITNVPPVLRGLQDYRDCRGSGQRGFNKRRRGTTRGWKALQGFNPDLITTHTGVEMHPASLSTLSYHFFFPKKKFAPATSGNATLPPVPLLQNYPCSSAHSRPKHPPNSP